MRAPAITVRPAVPADGPGMGRVHVLAWQIGYAGIVPSSRLDRLDPDQRGEAWAAVLAAPPGDDRHLVAVTGEPDARTIAGIATYGGYRLPAGERPPRRGELCELQMLNVHPDHWGTGVAQALMGQAVAGLRAQRDEATAALWVLERNGRGRRFYSKQGWRADGASRVETFDGVDLVELRYTLQLRPG